MPAFTVYFGFQDYAFYKREATIQMKVMGLRQKLWVEASVLVLCGQTDETAREVPSGFQSSRS